MFIHRLTTSRLVYILVSVGTFKAGETAFGGLDYYKNVDRIIAGHDNGYEHC
jgi:hypothetical protein